MKLNLTITGDRLKPSRYGVGGTPETEEYEVASIEGAEGGHQLLAGILRAAANDIDPYNFFDVKENS